MSKNNLIKVTIMDQEYTVNTTASPEYIEKLSNFLNDKMSEIKESGIEKDSQLRIAVLAAMNIADEFFQIKDKNLKTINEIEDKTRLLLSKINNDLNKNPMNTKILDGIEVAKFLKKNINEQILSLKKRNLKPGLAAILIGSDPTSQVYVKNKEKVFSKHNCLTKTFKFPDDSSEKEIIDFIKVSQ